MATDRAPVTVLEYWFGAPVAGDQVPETTFRWFGGGKAVDDEIRERFEPFIEAAARGELDTWAATPRGALALAVLLDQFPRNVYRGTPQSFAFDARAREVARAALERGDDRRVSLVERTFFYLPFEHSEDLADQRVAVERTAAAAAAASGPAKALLASFEDYAVRHLRVIERFGRFPHRNAILGRTSTPEETAFLAEPGSSF